MSVDCALITALPAEMGKLLFHFRHWNEVASGKNIYFETFSPSGLTLVGAVCTGMRQLHAAVITTDLVAKYQPKTIVLVGIAAGLERKIGLGDVVISSSLVDYELGMEAAGIAAMLRQLEQPPGFIVIKSICDYADSQKNDDWQAYAADAAASFAFSFVMDALTPQDMVLPHRAKTSNSEGLRVTLAGIYDLSELKVLCYDLDIDWDEMGYGKDSFLGQPFGQQKS